MADSSTPTRQRGIKMSPHKLTRARKAAGFASQAAVAEKIAELEGLDNPPKDVVNRAFRGVKVSPDTVERLAVALGQEAHTLLLSSDEAATATPASETVPTPTRTAKALLFPALIAAGLIVAIGLLTLRELQTTPVETVTASFAIPALAHLAATNTSLSVELASPELDDAFLNAVHTAFAPHFAMPTLAAAQIRSGSETTRGIASVATDGRLVLATERHGRWLGIVALLDSRGTRQQIWSDSLPVSRLADQKDALAQRLVDRVLAVVGRIRSPRKSFFALAEPQLDYLAGMSLLDGPAEELSLQRAQARFEAALRRSPRYARAHAGLCRALLEKYWMLDEARAIEDATLTCAQANDIAPEDPMVQLAQARLLQINGSNSAAIALLQLLLADDPHNADAWTLMAQSQLTSFQTTGDNNALAEGRSAALNATRNDAHIWLPYLRLGLIEYLRNDVAQAIAATELGLARDENTFLLANLSSYQTCAGQFADAEQTVMRARALSPAAYIGDEFLSQLKYFQGHFDEALALRQEAIDSFEEGEPAFHDMWGALADAHRQVGDTEEAINAYRLAINIVETDLLNADTSQSAAAARLYYYARVTSLAPDTLSTGVVDQLRAQIDSVAVAQTEPIGLRHIALTYALNDRLAEARQYLSKATTRCSGYRQYPDFIALSVQ